MKHLKKLIALVLVIFLGSSLLPANIPTIFAMSGSGTSSDPYIIMNGADLDNVRSNLSAFYVLGADINLSSFANWVPIGNLTSPFTGNFNGNGKTVTGLNINRPAQNEVGLFGYVRNSTIKNLNLKNVNVVGNNKVGGFAGSVILSKIENCHVSGAVKGLGSNVGGLIGVFECISVTSCSADCYVNGDSFVGGLIGYITVSWDSYPYGNTIRTSYSKGVVSGKQNLGGFVSIYGYCSMIDCYTKSDVIVVPSSTINPAAGSFAVDHNNLVYSGTLSKCYSAGSQLPIQPRRLRTCTNLGDSRGGILSYPEGQP